MDGALTPAAEPKMNRRDRAKAATRQKVIDAARRLFAAKGYAAATIRGVAFEAGLSTGAIFANFSGKADLWRAVKGCEPPVESPITRAAPAMLLALKAALQFIENGVDLGYVRMPSTPDPAVETPSLLREVIARAEGRA